VVDAEFTPATYNDPTHAEQAFRVFARRVKSIDPKCGEDFSQFGRTVEKIPTCFFGRAAHRKNRRERTHGRAAVRFTRAIRPVARADQNGAPPWTVAALDLLAKK